MARANSTIPATSISSCCSIPRRRRFRKASNPGRCSCASPRRWRGCLQERTGDGYVLRVDLRLRPDPAATPVAIAIAERLLLLRDARPELGARGDDQGAAGRRRPRARRSVSCSELAPFIWRKYFDYAAIADIHAMKRQIHAVRGHEQVTVPAMTSSSGAAAFARSSSSCRRSSSFSAAAAAHARRAHARHAARIGRRRLGRARRRSRNCRRPMSFSAASSIACRWSPTSRRSACRSSEPALDALRQILRLCRLDGFAARPHPSPAQRRDALCAPVRGCAGARARRGQPRLHRRRRRSRDADDAARARLSAPGSGDRDHSRLAFRPPRRGPQRPRARGADGVDAGARSTPSPAPATPTRRSPRSTPRWRACRRRWSSCRSCAPTRIARIVRRSLGSAPRLAQCRARARMCSTPRSIRRAPRLRRELRRRGEGARVGRSCPKPQRYEDALNRARDFAAEEMFLIGVRLLSGALDPDQAGRAYSALAQGLIGALLERVSRPSRSSTAASTAAASRCWRWASSARAK